MMPRASRLVLCMVARQLRKTLHNVGQCLDLQHWGQGQHTSTDITVDFKAVLAALLTVNEVAEALKEWFGIIKKEGISG